MAGVVNFEIASTIDEALGALAAGARPIAGGSDLVVASRQGNQPLPPALVAIDRLPELQGVSLEGGALRIGAGVNHATLATDQHVVSGYTALSDAAALVGSPATRNVGTIGGNIMNGSPAMDTGAPLMVLGARCELRSTSGSRMLAVGDLWLGPGETSAAADELCVAVQLPVRPPSSGSAYARLEYRRAMEIAVVGAAASVVLQEDGSVGEVAVALTAVAPTIVTVDGLGDQIVGRPLDADALATVARLSSDQADPISDLRAGADYRKHTVGVMAHRAVFAASARARGEHIPVPFNHAPIFGSIA